MIFTKGTQVEVTSNEPGFQESWFVGTIIHRAKSKMFLVEYHSLVKNTESLKPLREFVDLVQLRPIPPKNPSAATQLFELNQDVDAYLNDGWWKGVVTKIIVPGSRYSVFFRPTKEEKEFDHSELRVHLDWVNGDWATPSLNQQGRVVVKQNEGRVQSLNPTESSALGKDITSPQTPSRVSNIVDIEENGGTVQSLKSTGRSEIGTDMASPQTPSGVGDIVYENGLSSLRSICKNMDGQSTLNETESLSYAVFSTQENMGSDTKSNGDAVRPFEKVKEREASEAPKDSNTEVVLKRKRGRPIGSGKRKKNRTTKAFLDKTLQSKGSENAYPIQEMTGVQTKSIPFSSPITDDDPTIRMLYDEPRALEAKDLGGFDNDSFIKKMKDVQTRCMPLQSHIGIKGQPLSVEKDKSVIVKDIEGLVDKQMAGVLKRSRKPSMKGMVEKQMVDILRRKRGSSKGSRRKASVKGREDKFAGNEMTNAQTKCTPQPSKTGEDHQPLSVFVEKCSSHLKKRNEGPKHEAAREEMIVLQTESAELLSHSGGMNQPVSLCPENSNVLQVSTSNQITSNGITIMDTSMENLVTPQSCNAVESSCYQLEHDTDENGDERALHSADVIANTVSSSIDNECLPFIKNSHLWRSLECSEVFRLFPQKPHFLPLEKYNEELREGYALGNMLNYSNVVESTLKAKFDDPRSMFDNKLKALADLEELGFTVEPIRYRLEELRSIKDSYSQVEDTATTSTKEIVEEKRKFHELQETITQLNLKLQTLVMEKDMQFSYIANLQRSVEGMKEKSQGFRQEFDTMVGSPLVNTHQ